MTLERRTPLRRTGRFDRRTALGAAGPAKPARTGRTPQQARRAALDAEWRAYSSAQRRARPRCEAGPAMRAGGIAAGDACWGSTVSMHHKRRGRRYGWVPSQGLTDDDVVAVCPACHAYIHDSGDDRVRDLDLLRPPRKR